VPLEGLFNEVTDIQLILGNVVQNRYTEELHELEGKVNAKVSEFSTKIFQDQQLAKKFDHVYLQRGVLKLDEDDKAVLRDLHRGFESSGALLSPEGQKKIIAIDQELIDLAQKFYSNGLAAAPQQAVLITDPAELAGLTPNDIESLEKNARDKGHAQGWLFIPERLLVDEMLEYAESREFRRKIFEALNRTGKVAPYDNQPVIARMQQLRHEFAQLLGYKNYAAFARTRHMTGLAEAKQLLADVAAKALPKFEADMRELEKFSAAQGGPAKLEPYDVPFWKERQRTALYNFDSNGFAQYLQLDNVLESMFSEAGRLFDLEFREVPGKYPVIHPDIRVYDVVNKGTGTPVGILHCDLYARPGEKGGGAWMSQLQSKDAGRPNTVILNMNITKPPAGKPALVALSQYITTYHEFGHSLQGLMGTDVKYRSQQGTNAPADFVEFHSMVNERRATLEENLHAHALHAATGLPPDAQTVAALHASSSHFETAELLKLVQNSIRDIEFHSIDPKSYLGEDGFEQSVALNSAYIDHVRPYPLSRFGHLFSSGHGGYTAGYVDYLIAQVHAADGFEPFKDDPYNITWAKKLKHLYNRGSGGDPATLYRDYRGRDATPAAMLREAGIGAAKP
jgi:peptidyl-dipeptidase Dcp